MLGTREHFLTDCLGRIHVFTTMLHREETGGSRWSDVTECWAYARYLLEDIAEAWEDPFNYKLLDLWMDFYRCPWEQPEDLEALINDLADAISSGDLKVYVDYDPLDHVPGFLGSKHRKAGA